jgi:hypothetical protein
LRALAAILALTAGACSSPEEAGAPPATLDEQRALTEAEAMIPAGELPAATPTPSATPNATP